MVDTFKILITTTAIAAAAVAHPVARQESSVTGASSTGILTTAMPSMTGASSTSATAPVRTADLSHLRGDCTIH